VSAPKRSNRKATRPVADTTAGGAVVAGDFPAAPPRPEHEVPMSQGAWRYSPGDKLFARGVYRETADDVWLPVAPLPYILERLVRRDGYGRRAGVDYRIAMVPDPGPAEVSVCDDEEIRTGAWASKLDVALSRDRKIIDAAGTAIDYAARHEAEAREITPRWHGDQFELPSADVGPPGYGAHTDDETSARAVWREVGEIAARNPKVALALGVTLGGMFIAPLRRQPFILHTAGHARGGKTATMSICAALYGDPEQLVAPWNTTNIGMTSFLGDLGCLPAFMDELSASGMTAQKTEELIFRITQGAKRRTGTKMGGHKSSAPWHSTMMTTGNPSILGALTNEGAAARVLELAAPITESAPDAERLEELAPAAFGWPLRWVLAELNLNRVRELVDEAEAELPLPAGGVPRTLGRHLALAVAAATLLVDVTGVTAIRDAVITAARDLLERSIAELAERGIKPGERLLAAVTQALSSRPAAYPTRTTYLEGVTGTGFLPSRDVEGWLVTDDRVPGDVAVLTTKLDVIAEAAGIVDTLPALRELRDAKILLPSGETDGRLRRRLRVGAKWCPDVYVFKLPEPDEADENQPTPPPDQKPTPAPAAAASSEPAAESMPADHAPVAEPDAAEPAAAEVPGPVVATGHAGPVWIAEHAEPMPCRICDKPTPTDDRHGPVHAQCAITGTAAATTALRHHGATAPKSAGRKPKTPTKRNPVQTVAPRLHLAGVVDPAGLWLPGADSAVPVDVSTVDAAYAAAKQHGVRQLWLHPTMHDQLGIPTSRPATENPAAGFAHPWATSATLTLDPDGLSAWTNVAPATGDGRRLALVFPGYEPRAPWNTATDGRILRDAVLTFARVVGEPYYLSPNETSAQIIIKSARPRGENDVDKLAPVTMMPPPAGNIDHLETWSRVLMDIEDSAIHVHQYDLNAAELGVTTDIYLGVGNPVHHGPRTWNTKVDKKLASYNRVALDPTKFDPRLPDLGEYWRRSDTDDGTAWLPTDLVVLLDEIGIPFEIVDSWIWRRSHRTLRSYYTRLTEARATTRSESAAESDRLAGKVIGGLYKSRVGDFQRERSRISRPDFRDAIKARRVANMYRRAKKIGETENRYPIAMYVDALYYVGDDPNPWIAAPAGLPMVPEPTDAGPVPAGDLSQYKPEVTVPLAAVREYTGERGFHRHILREAKKGKP
jgi:uncharacterized protein DUF927